MQLVSIPSKNNRTTNILQRIDSLGRLLNLTTNDLGNELVSELSERAAGCLPLHDFDHLLANGTNLRRTSICGLLDLVRASLGEGDSKKPKEIIIGRLHGDIGFDQRLPLAHEGSQFVGCEIETVEVGQTVLALNLVHTKLNLAESMVFIVLQVSERHLENSTLQGVIGVFETTGAVDQSLSNTITQSARFPLPL